MSGTSLDGLDIAACEFCDGPSLSFKLLAAETINYSDFWLLKLQNAAKCSGRELIKLDHQYGAHLGNAVKEFEKRFNIQSDLVASHGHTVFHQPAEGYTFQLGSGLDIMVASGRDVVSDFRSADIALGGQGAPLVPIGDKLLFSQFDACLNLGGFANISFDQNNERIAFDICPLNIPLNQMAAIEGLEYDKGGFLASSGAIIPALLESLNSLPFFQQAPPKSLGKEWYDSEFYPLLKAYASHTTSDLLRTLVEVQAKAITGVLPKNINKVLVTGGGTWNDFLFDRLNELRPHIWCLEDASITDFKEAIVFAFLGWLRVNDKVNCLASVTGASRDHSSGTLHLYK